MKHVVSKLLICLAVILCTSAPRHVDAADTELTRLLSQVKESYAGGDHKKAARLAWQIKSIAEEGELEVEPAEFFLAASLEKMGFPALAAEYYVHVAKQRRVPELLPRAVESIESIILKGAFDEDRLIGSFLADADIADTLPSHLADFVTYWQGVYDFRRGLMEWGTERLSRVSRKGYYFFASLYVSCVRLMREAPASEHRKALVFFANRFGTTDLVAAHEAMRRRGDNESILSLTLRAMLDDEQQLSIRHQRLPKGWQKELAMLGFARIQAEASLLLERARDLNEERLGRPYTYEVRIAGVPMYRRSPRFEDRAESIRAVSTRRDAVREMVGIATHGLARLLYEQKQYAAAYDTLGQIPEGTSSPSDILLERAWSKYKAGDPHRAMGLLFALDAPVYRDLVAPEKYLLRGLIYRSFCHFRAAKLAAGSFRDDWSDALVDMREGTPLKDIESIRKAALRQPACRTRKIALERLRKEQKRLNPKSDGWQKGQGAALNGVYDALIKRTEAQIAQCLDLSTATVATQILTTEEQVNLLEYEVGQAVFQRFDEKRASQLRRPTPKVPISSSKVYFRFKGEHWSDELGNYQFNIRNRCVD